MLNRRCVEFVGDGVQKGLPGGPVIAEHPDFDQTVREQIHIDLMQDGRCEPIIADHHDRVEVVRLGAVGAQFLCRKFEFHPRSIVLFVQILW